MASLIRNLSGERLAGSASPGQDGAAFARARYQRRAQCSQGALRLAIAASLTADLVLFPPVAPPVSTAVIIAYAVWSVVLLSANSAGWWLGARMTWIPVLVDLVVLTALVAISGAFADIGTTPQNAFVLVPVLAAFQYRPEVTLAATAASAVAFAVGVALGHSEDDPYVEGSLFLTVFILVVGTACTLLSWIQQAKMRSIARLAEDRSALVARVMSAEDRERGALAETLHDGALQNVLAAFQDLEELQDGPGAAGTVGRTRSALREATRQLRTSVSTLHPAVLDSAGLVPALGTLLEETAGRGGFAAALDVRTEESGPADQLLYRTARELLANVVKHAQASSVTVRLWADSAMVHLEVADDGSGMPGGALEKSVAEGHIGLASHRIRVEEAGGSLQIRPNTPRGTVATVSLPRHGLRAAGSQAA
ncbi:ATP-binding protein [Streptomyces sp. NPDC008121]|uniref:sensor histidine kinase n=1 Tax=Streptomyces sp. NPDC008121 TaxID=3364809 RepID=UPI0036F0F5D0